MSTKYWVDTTGYRTWNPSWLLHGVLSLDTAGVKSTSRYSSDAYAPWNACDFLGQSLIGGTANNGWMAATVGNQKFNIAYFDAFIANRIFYSNYHESGASNLRGVKTFTLYGSNTYTDFTNITYATELGTQLATGTFLAHDLTNTPVVRYLLFQNNTAYHYYLFRFADNYGDATYTGLRTLGLQYDTQPSRWALTSGGTPDSGNIPQAGDDVVIEQALSIDTYVVDTPAVCNNLTLCSGTTISDSFGTSRGLQVNGNLIAPGCTFGAGLVQLNTGVKRVHNINGISSIKYGA